MIEGEAEAEAEGEGEGEGEGRSSHGSEGVAGRRVHWARRRRTWRV